MDGNYLDETLLAHRPSEEHLSGIIFKRNLEEAPK